MTPHPQGRDDKPAVLSPDEARSAVKTGAMRYVLTLSMAGAVICLFLAWLYFA
jgi:hypothetical protein